MNEHEKLVNALLNAAFHQGELERDETASYNKLDKAAEAVAKYKDPECPDCGEELNDSEDLHFMVMEGCCKSCYDDHNFEVSEEMKRQQE